MIKVADDMNQMYLTNIYRTFLPNTKEYILTPHITFLYNWTYMWTQSKSQKIKENWSSALYFNRPIWIKDRFQKLKQMKAYRHMEIIQLPTQGRNTKRNQRIHENEWNSRKMNAQLIQTYGTEKAVLRNKFIVLSAFNKLVRFHTSELTAHVKTLEKSKESYTPMKRSQQ